MKTNDQITQPTLMADGLAIYHIGQGEPLFLMPYPHASASAPTVDTKLATLLASLPRQILTFDPPGAYSSTRSGRADLPEMLNCALETLNVCQISETIDVIGHSMSGLCALALAIEHPERVRRLVLVGSVSGFPAVRRWSIPHNWRWCRDREYWQVLWWGFRLFIGWNNHVSNTFSVSAANSFAGLCQNLSRLPAYRSISNGYGDQLCLIKTNEPHR